MAEEINNLLSSMNEEIQLISNSVSDIIDIPNLPSNTRQVKDLLVNVAQIIEDRILNYNVDSYKVKSMMKGKPDKMDIPSSSEEQMEEGKRPSEESFIGKESLIQKKRFLHNRFLKKRKS